MIVGITQQTDVLWPVLTGREHMQLYSALKGLSDRECLNDVDITIRNVGLDEPDKRVKELSGGNKRKVSIGCAMVGRPSIIFLDGENFISAVFLLHGSKI